MAHPPGFDSEEAYKSSWDRRCKAHYCAMVGYRYHRKRQRFFDLLDKWTKALSVIAGASLLADPIKQHLPAVALSISAIGLLSLVFSYGDKKQSHKEVADAYALAVAKIEGLPTEQLTPALIALWDAEVTTLNAKEPPQLHLLVTVCEREQSIANGHPDHIPPIPLFKRALADWLSFS